MTWNCKHITNAETLPGIYKVLRDSGYEHPLIVTPEEFSGMSEKYIDPVVAEVHATRAAMLEAAGGENSDSAQTPLCKIPVTTTSQTPAPPDPWPTCFTI